MSMFSSRRGRRSLRFALALTGACAILGTAAPATSASSVADAAVAVSRPGVCRPAAVALGFSDALDKLTIDGATVGGLSDVAYDPRSKSYVSSVDNNNTDPSRLW